MCQKENITSPKLKVFSVLLLLFSGMFFISCNDVSEIGGCEDPFEDDAWQVVWEDEFDGDVIDESKWSFDLGDGCDIGICGWGNNELEYYTNRTENAYSSNGRLIIKAIKESPLYLGEHQYTSARMVTKNKGDWKYGRVDVAARLPQGQGIWPAIWMLPTENIYGGWPKSGEIDIMELIGSEPNRVSGAIHFGHDYWRFIAQNYYLESGTFSNDFHLFSTIWTEDCIRFFVDGEQIGIPLTRSSTLPTTWPFDNEFHLLLNIAVGGNLPGDPTPTTPFPQAMVVDYVKVFQK